MKYSFGMAGLMALGAAAHPLTTRQSTNIDTTILQFALTVRLATISNPQSLIRYSSNISRMSSTTVPSRTSPFKTSRMLATLPHTTTTWSRSLSMNNPTFNSWAVHWVLQVLLLFKLVNTNSPTLMCKSASGILDQSNWVGTLSSPSPLSLKELVHQHTLLVPHWSPARVTWQLLDPF